MFPRRTRAGKTSILSGLFLAMVPVSSSPIEYRSFFPSAGIVLVQSGPVEGQHRMHTSKPLLMEGPDESSLAAQVTPDTPPRRAASLRLAEEGRMLLQEGEYTNGLSKLEKAIALDSGNHYAYYYLALAHYHQGHYQQSLNFLEVLGTSLSDRPLWLARVHALEGENYRALRFFGRADRSYLKALALDPSNRAALIGLTTFPRGDVPPDR